MSSSLFLGLSALKAVDGLKPFVFTYTGVTFLKLIMFSASNGPYSFFLNPIPIFLVITRAD
jgi:hypothetical protein